MLQLELFPNEADLETRMDKLEKSMEKLRKSLYAAKSEDRKMYQELAHEFQIINLNLCKGRLPK
jgi:outer membrane murein-binding lipoprotein Lpp